MTLRYSLLLSVWVDPYTVHTGHPTHTLRPCSVGSRPDSHRAAQNGRALARCRPDVEAQHNPKTDSIPTTCPPHEHVDYRVVVVLFLSCRVLCCSCRAVCCVVLVVSCGVLFLSCRVLCCSCRVFVCMTC